MTTTVHLIAGEMAALPRPPSRMRGDLARSRRANPSARRLHHAGVSELGDWVWRRVRWRGREGQPSYRAARSCDCSARRYGEGPCLLRDPSVWGIARAAGSPRAGVPPPGRPTRCTSRSGWASGSSTNATRSSPSRDGCGRRWSFASAVRRVRRRRPRRRCRAWSRPLVRGHRGDAVVVGRGSGQRKPEGEPAERELDLDRLFVDQRHLRTVRSSHVNALVLLPRRRESCPTSAPRGRCELVRTVRNP